MKNDKNLQNIKKLAFGALFAALGGAAAINVAGYWAYESAVVYHDLVSALPSVPFNFAQSVVGALIFLLLAKPAAALLRRTAA